MDQFPPHLLHLLTPELLLTAMTDPDVIAALKDGRESHPLGIDSLPVPLRQCDNCAQRVGDARVCRTCRNQFYCSRACQAADASHASNCSKVMLSSEYPTYTPLPVYLHAPTQLFQVLHQLDDRIYLDQLSLTTLGNAPVTAVDRLTRLKSTPEFRAFMSYRLPEVFAYPAYPGHSPADPYDFKHQLVLMARAIFLMTVDHLKKHAIDEQLWSKVWYRDSCMVLFHNEDGGLEFEVMKRAVAKTPGVRIFWPKVLANPRGLSAGEYWDLVTPTFWLWHCHSPSEDLRREPFLQAMVRILCDLVELQLQAQECPALLDVI